MSEASEWVTIRFGDLIEGCRGVSYQPHDLLDDYTEDSVVLLRANNIQQGRLQFNNIQIVPKKLVKKTQHLSIGDIAVCMSNGSKHLVGKSAQLVDQANFDCTVGAFCSVFKPKERTDSNFIKQLFLSDVHQAHIDLSLAGSAINNLKNSDIESIIFKIPSKAIWGKIDDILSTIDRTITNTEALIEKYQQIKAGPMHDLFTRGIGADGKLHPPRAQAPELYRESSIGWIPKEWSVETVESLGGLVTSGSRDWAQYYSNEGGVFIRIGNLTREHINLRLEKIQYVSPPINSDGQRTKLLENDILVSITADLGIIGVIPEGLGDAYINQHIALIRFSSTNINSRFFGHFFASQAFQNYVSRMNDSGAKAGLNLPAVRALPVVTTTKNEQNIIAQKLDAIDTELDVEKQVLVKLKHQKSGLMHDLLTGKVQVNIKETA